MITGFCFNSLLMVVETSKNGPIVMNIIKI